MDYRNFAFLACVAVIAASCSNDDPVLPSGGDAQELSEEYYAGGRLGTTFNTSASAFEDPTPAVEQAGLLQVWRDVF